MPLNGHVRKFAAAQTEIAQSGGFADGPEVEYLLGFEREKFEALPVKTYIRRLWLAFQSSKSLMPKYFFDIKAEEFSKEIEHWVSVFANDPDKLAAERAKEHYVVSMGHVQERGEFLEDTVTIILKTRDWGDVLWGHRKLCRAPLENAKREPGDDTPPKWPQDTDR